MADCSKCKGTGLIREVNVVEFYKDKKDRDKKRTVEQMNEVKKETTIATRRCPACKGKVKEDVGKIPAVTSIERRII